MGDPALELARASAANEPSWGLRLAQQVFAALLEHGRRYSSFRVAAHRQRARAGLRGLSVDDRGQLERWLALQVLTAPAADASGCLDTLATVEPQLAGSVRAQLTQQAARLDPDDATRAA